MSFPKYDIKSGKIVCWNFLLVLELYILMERNVRPDLPRTIWYKLISGELWGSGIMESTCRYSPMHAQGFGVGGWEFCGRKVGGGSGL